MEGHVDEDHRGDRQEEREQIKMCIIVVKRRGVPLPSEAILKNCWDSNPDGAGYMYAKEGKVVIEKGFMKFKKLLESLDALPKSVLEESMILHFRIGTHGAVSKECTHPFPVCDSYETMRQTSSTCEIGMAHNGVISWAASHEDVKKAELVSDSMWFANNVASKYMEMLEFDKTYNIHPMMNEAIGTNKFAFMKGDGYIWVLGNWGVVGDKEDLWYSNNSHTYTRVRSVTTNQCDFFGHGVGASAAHKTSNGGVAKYFQPESGAAIIRVTEEERKQFLNKFKPKVSAPADAKDADDGPSCSKCLFRMQKEEPCKECFKLPKEYTKFVPLGKHASLNKGPPLCMFCSHGQGDIKAMPCVKCIIDREALGVSTGFEEGVDKITGGET